MNEPSVPVEGPLEGGARALRAAGLCGILVLIAACFGPVLFGGRQFAFRDAGHFYYPLYWSVQQQWRAGQLPLWEPAENGGIPLLGSPQAAVLYPGKLIYAVMPYAWGARLYIVAHVLLAFAAMRALLRSWGVGASGSMIAGFAYAFGSPVLFQYCNVIYLVGAAWAPLGFRSADRWLRLGRRWGVIELALVLAMQALGGDLEAAYLTGLCAAGYAVGLASRRPSIWIWTARITVVLIGWAVLGPWLTVLRSRPAQVVLAVAWGVGLLALLARGLRGRGASPLGARMVGLGISGVLAVALGAAQFVPVAENLAASGRWSETTLFDIEAFSLEPYRVVEWAWPNAFGSMLAGERSWLRALPPINNHRVWVPSLYFGALPLALALGAAGFRGGPPWRSWLSAVAILGFLAAAGKFVGPLEWLGFGAGGSVYRLMATFLPGFSGFRFPSKILVFVSLAMAGLAGIGWDRVVDGQARRATAWAVALLFLSLLTLAIVGSARGSILEALNDSALGGSSSVFGPFDARGVWLDMVRNLGHASIASILALAVIVLARSRPVLSGVAAILILAVDLSVANMGLILTLPQEEFDRPSRASQILRAAEGSRPSEERFRTYRMSAWTPNPWNARSSPTRSAEYAIWERDTLYPNFALLEGIDSILTESGSVEHEDFESFFQPYLMRVDRKVADEIGVEVGTVVICYPRRALDLWNVRYFLLPIDPADWKQGNRALATFLDRTEQIYPPPGEAPDRTRLDDFQIRRNLAAFPRAWTVHDFIALDPDSSKEFADLGDRATQYLARGSSTKPIPKSLAIDPRTSALIETGSPGALDAFRPTGIPSPSEMPKIVREGPTLVELSVTLEKPGLVVLADRFDPGWRATIDDAPAVVLKANKLMRATAVGAGSHRIVYRYDPPSFRLGANLSLMALVALVPLGFWASRGGAMVEESTPG